MKISAVLALLASSVVVEGAKLESSQKSTEWEKVRIVLPKDEPSNVEELALSYNNDQFEKLMKLEDRLENLAVSAEKISNENEENAEENSEDLAVDKRSKRHRMMRRPCKGDASWIKICKSYRAT